MNDPTMAAVGGVYTAMWNNYLNTELLFTATSNFVDLNDQAFQFWDFRHTDPSGAVQVPDSQGNPTLYTAGDLAATMAANPDLLVLSANGYYDAVTPFFQTKLTLDAMPLKNASARANLTIRYYPSGPHGLSGRQLAHGAQRPTSRRCTTLLPPLSPRERSRAAWPYRANDRTPIHPYFILRGPASANPPVGGGGRTWDVADLCAAYSWPTGLAGGGSHRDHRIGRRLGAVRHRRLFRQGAIFPRRRSSTCRSAGPAMPPIPAAIRRPTPTARWRSTSRSPRPPTASRPAPRRPIRVYWADRTDWGVDGDRHRGRRRRRMRRLLDLLGLGRSQLAGGGTGGGHRLRRQAERRRAGGDGGRHDHLRGGRRQRFLRRRTQSGECRSALVVAIRRRLRRHAGSRMAAAKKPSGTTIRATRRPLKKSLGSGIAV